MRAMRNRGDGAAARLRRQVLRLGRVVVVNGNKPKARQDKVFGCEKTVSAGWRARLRAAAPVSAPTPHMPTTKTAACDRRLAPSCPNARVWRAYIWGW